MTPRTPGMAETDLAMAVGLDELPGQPPELRGLKVRRVRTTARLKSWANGTASNWTPPDTGVLSCYHQTASASPDPDVPQRRGSECIAGSVSRRSGEITEYKPKGGSP